MASAPMRKLRRSFGCGIKRGLVTIAYTVLDVQ
jgi:hypothetical protein